MHSSKAWGQSRVGLDPAPGSRSFASFYALGIVISSLFLLASCSKPVQPVATVSVNTEQLGAMIPKDFLGFASEGMGLPKASTPTAQGLGPVQPPSGVPADAKLAYVFGEPGAPNTVFETFMENLNPSLFRLGGDSQDRNCWDPKAAPHPKRCRGTLTPGVLKLYSTVVGTAGWRMILGLNLMQNSPRWMLREVTQGIAKQIPASQIYGLELGNEPDLYPGMRYRPKTYSPKDYIKEALGYIHAVRRNPISRKYGFVGPAICCRWKNPTDLNTILNAIGPDLKLVSVHYYTSKVCGHKIVTVPELLAPEQMQKFDDLSKKLVAVANKHNLPIAMAEANSAACGGMAGVSNSFASTVWGLDFMLNVASDGYSNLNIQFSFRKGGTAYNPVNTYTWKTGSQVHYVNAVQPLYYAMYAFAKNASGEHLLPASIETKANITAFATTACPSCDVHVFVINKDGKASGPVSVHLGGNLGTARLLMLQAPSLHSFAPDVHYGGQQFNTEGHIGTPSTTSVAPDAKGDYSFTLPNAAAAVLTISRRPGGV